MFLLQCNIVATLFLCVIMCVCVDCIANTGSVPAQRWGMSLVLKFFSGSAWASASIDPLFPRFLDLALFLINCLIRWSWSNPLWMNPCIHSEYWAAKMPSFAQAVPIVPDVMALARTLHSAEMCRVFQNLVT